MLLHRVREQCWQPLIHVPRGNGAAEDNFIIGFMSNVTQLSYPYSDNTRNPQMVSLQHHQLERPPDAILAGLVQYASPPWCRKTTVLSSSRQETSWTKAEQSCINPQHPFQKQERFAQKPPQQRFFRASVTRIRSSVPQKSSVGKRNELLAG